MVNKTAVNQQTERECEKDTERNKGNCLPIACNGNGRDTIAKSWYQNIAQNRAIETRLKTKPLHIKHFDIQDVT